MPLDLAADLAPMEAKLVACLPEEGGWRFEPKWDGFRCLAFKDGEQVLLQSKSGKSLGRFFPEVANAVRALPQSRFVLDGELTISIDGHMAFDALQARLHPAASRIAHLAKTTPALYVVFDCLADEAGEVVLAQALRQRLIALKRLARAWPKSAGLRLSPGTADRTRALSWRERTGGASTACWRSGSATPTRRASAPCSRSNATGRRAAWWVASAGSETPRSWPPCCLVFTMRTVA